MRLRKVKDVEEKILEFSNVIILEPTKYRGKWRELFGNDNPIYLEIGMGKGKFIRENALRNPNINYIGCEIAQSIIYKAAKETVNIPNLLLLNYDAFKLEECFSDGEIDKIYLTFSDPWPKSRHEKRRLTADAFLNVYKNILVKDGFIEFKTDNRKLFEFSVMKFNEMRYDILELSLDLHHSGYEEIITTEYEEKFIAKGQVIYFIKVRVK